MSAVAAIAIVALVIALVSVVVSGKSQGMYSTLAGGGEQTRQDKLPAASRRAQGNMRCAAEI